MLRSRRQSQTIEMSLALMSATDSLMQSEESRSASATRDMASSHASAHASHAATPQPPVALSKVESEFQQVYEFLQRRSPLLPTSSDFRQSLGRPMSREDLVDLIFVVRWE